nr:3D domain-containing protein [uncultured Romboutsia sp.]
MKRKLIMSTLAMTVMLGVNTLAFADTINNNDNTQNTTNKELTYNNGYVNSDKVNFRKEASINSDIYKVLDENTSVIILGYEGNWSKVKINDTVGYVYTKYITNVNKVTDISNIDESNTVSLDVKATAYAGDTITSTGTVPTEGTTIAVDPSVIPYGSKVYIPELGKVFTAEDCGSAIKGNRIDIFMDSEAKCNEWGVKNITIYVSK